jgi:hypothetical protein
VVATTLVEPAATGVTSPTPLSIVKSVASEVVHESVEESPGLTDDGLAESVQASSGGVPPPPGGVTVTVVVQVTVPPAPVAVPV